jgi:hypothetical protein
MYIKSHHPAGYYASYTKRYLQAENNMGIKRYTTRNCSVIFYLHEGFPDGSMNLKRSSRFFNWVCHMHRKIFPILQPTLKEVIG